MSCFHQKNAVSTCCNLICSFHIFFFFNWGIIALQYCVGFCHTSTWLSHRYPYVHTFPPSWTPLTSPFSYHPSQLLQEHWVELSLLCYTANSHLLSISHMENVYASLVAQTVKNMHAMQEIQVRSLGQEDFLEKRMAILQYSGLGNLMDRGTWWATVHGDVKNRTHLSKFHFHFFHFSKYMFPCYSLNLSYPFPPQIHKSVLYVYVTIMQLPLSCV